MRHFTNVDDIPVYHDNDFLFNRGRNMTFASKVSICPKCLIKQIFVKNYEEDSFHYEEIHDTDPENGRKLGINSESDFDVHIQNCKSCFQKNGIKKATSENLIDLGKKMNSISLMETGYSRISIHKSTFFYVVDGLPVSYMAFDPSFTRENSSSWILKDMYTFPKFRNNGYASKLFEYATQNLKLNLKHLWISFPISDLGKNLVLKYAVNKVTAVAMVYPGTYNIEDLRQRWDEIMRMY